MPILLSNSITVGLSNEKLLDNLKRRRHDEFDPDSGKGFAYVYTLNNAQFQSVQKAFDLFEFNEDSQQSNYNNPLHVHVTYNSTLLVSYTFNSEILN